MRLDWRIKAATGCVILAAAGIAALTALGFDSAGTLPGSSRTAMQTEYDVAVSQLHANASWDALFRNAQR